LRPAHRSEFAKFFGGAVVTVFVESFAAVTVKFVEPFDALLLAVALFLFSVARFLFAVAFFAARSAMPLPCPKS
jgi:hypothetical protein